MQRKPVERRVGLDPATMRLRIKQAEDLVVRADEHVQPRRQGADGYAEHRAIQDEGSDDVLHPRRAALRRCRNDDVVVPEPESLPAGTISEEAVIPGHTPTLRPPQRPTPTKCLSGPAVWGSRDAYAGLMTDREFDIVCEIEPATRPDLMRVRHQIGVLSRAASSFLIPDNHIGRATVSSIAVAHEVALMGGRSIACLNARDRNLLGFRRDLLTAAAYGVDEFLFVYGDRPETGSRSDDLTVRSMLDEAKRFSSRARSCGTARRRDLTAHCASILEGAVPTPLRSGQLVGARPPRVAVRRGLRRAGVRRCLGAELRDDGPQALGRYPRVDRSRAPIHALDENPDAGVDFACQMLHEIRASGASKGVHLIPVSRYRQIAARLET